jgi:hypothetical protein
MAQRRVGTPTCATASPVRRWPVGGGDAAREPPAETRLPSQRRRTGQPLVGRSMHPSLMTRARSAKIAVWTVWRADPFFASPEGELRSRPPQRRSAVDRPEGIFRPPMSVQEGPKARLPSPVPRETRAPPTKPGSWSCAEPWPYHRVRTRSGRGLIGGGVAFAPNAAPPMGGAYRCATTAAARQAELRLRSVGGDKEPFR